MSIANDNSQDVSGRKEKWGQARRLEFIDSRLLWDGHVNRSDLTDFFHISPPQATLDLAEYVKRAPGNVYYDPRQKSYLASPSFKAVLADSSSSRYLAELYALRTSILGPDLSFLGALPAAEVVRSPARAVNSTLLRDTLHAIRERRFLLITYQTMARSEPDQRQVSPVALGYDGFRWHIRAFCHVRNEYRDFVFARVLSAALAGSTQVSIDNDIEWKRMIDITIAPNPDLSEGAKRVIELDYGMIDGKLTIACRQAMGYYLLTRLGLRDDDFRTGKVQQVILVNRFELAKYLPGLIRA
ncbi:WYL domain-containing protein [Xanthomonas bundabergensis]|uniref:WYL domain-containing protein n=1 Tax=Xanthomonas bundabergensis TaxID=3160842 RepID=UPI003516A878